MEKRIWEACAWMDENEVGGWPVKEIVSFEFSEVEGQDDE